jgi:uncharacterized membrane protein
MRVQRSLVALAILMATMGHGGGCCGSEEDSELFGPPTGAACDQSLTYDNFGEQFMTNYCVRCHTSQLTGTARQGAPLGHDFDMIDTIRPVMDHIDETAGSGPDATNDSMPPDGPQPTLEEREMLAAWIACGAP